MEGIPIKPIVLLADSQLLFWHGPEGLFLQRIADMFEAAPAALRAAYIGASNGDLPEFFDLFVGAMAGINVRDCRMIPSTPTPDDLAFLESADIILLSGGDVVQGWRVLQGQDLVSGLIARYYQGAVLIGISAGAVQLGLRGWRGENPGRGDLFETIRLVPFVIDVHQNQPWQRLSMIVQDLGSEVRGIGIPAGAGALYHPDHTLEPVRHPLVEISAGEEGVQQAFLMPETEGS